MKLFVCVFALLLSLAAAQDMTTCSTTLTQGTYSATFTANGDSVEFVVSADTSGWVAIGFSADQLMPNTDVILGASDGNDNFINDRYATARAQPPVDASEDITDASVDFIGGTTTIRFTRSRGSTDTNDISLDECRYFLWAWGGIVGVYSNPTSVLQHSNRGSFANRICIPGTCVNGVVNCGNLPPPVDGAITDPLNANVGEVATYSCNPGYLLGYGDENRTCQDNGMWSGEAPNCTVVSCPVLPAPMNGSITYEVPGRIFQTEATYACDSGFELIGGMTRECQANGTWSGDEPTCLIVMCPALNNPVNGNVDDSVRNFETTVMYTCDEGFAINGESTRTCQANQVWSGEAPTCRNASEVNCPDLNDPVNGMVSFLTTDFGAVANYTCNDGFMLVGVAMRSCQGNDAWTGEEPTCQGEGDDDGAGVVQSSLVVTALFALMGSLAVFKF